MKKAFDQTVRDLKREVNKKVLKVPGIEQKILDATSNEPWGPHGSHLADIAQATRNYHEYQMIMNVIWKRINDTGKNWRHVYKALTVLEYLVGHGSERVIDEIREHAYQISTLSDFQYLDHNGRDQGSNVRRKSQTLVALVNDKEKIQEAREKALANKDKYRSTHATGGRLSSFSGSGSYGDRYDDDRFEGRYGSRDEDRNGYGRERDWGYRDDDRYGRGGDSYNRDGDRYGRDSEDRYGRDSYKDDDYRGGRGSDDYKFGPRNRSFDRDRERTFDDDDRYSSRSGGRADDPSQDDRRLERKLSEQSVGGPPGYEEAVKDAHNHMQDERSGANVAVPVTKASTPPAPKEASPVAPFPNNEVDSFDEFDPRGSMPAVPPAASSSGGDFFGAPSASDPIYALALVPVTSTTATSEVDAPTNPGFGTDFVALSSASSVLSQSSADPFGDAPFKATQQENFPVQQPSFAPASSFRAAVGSNGGAEPLPQAAPKAETVPSFDFGDPLGGLTYTSSLANGQEHSSAHPAFVSPEAPMVQVGNGFMGSHTPSGSASLVPPQVSHQPGAPTNVNMFQVSHQPGAPTNVNMFSQNASVAPQVPQPLVNTHAQFGPSSQPASLASTSIPPLQTQKSKDKFETKSTVWTDTLNRGLVNLNISGSKINPLADIGIDFDSINRMEKRKEKEKSSATAVTSTITMGKAMGSGSGIGRVGAGSLAPPVNPMMGGGMRMGMPGNGIGMGMGMGGAGGMGMGMGMGGYGAGMNQPMGMGMGMGMNMGVGMGTGQGAPMRPPSGMPGVGYNPMMGMGNYSSQQPYGGGYR